MKISKLGPISHFLSPVSCDLLVLQGLRCEWGAGVLNLVLLLSLSHTGHWKFNMAPHGKELSEDMKKTIVALQRDDVGNKKIAKTLKLSCSTVAKTIQRFNRTGSAMVDQSQCSDHTPHTASNWSSWLSSQKEGSSKDNAQESPQTFCWRQAD